MSASLGCDVREVSLQDPGTTAQEVSSVVVGVKSDEIAMQDTEKDLIADREDAVDLTAWEWGVQEEANLHILPCISKLFPKHGW